MENLIISKENLKVLLEKIAKDADKFIAPKREHLDDVIFGDVQNGEDFLLEYEGNAITSPRIIFFPQSEPIYEYKSAKELEVKELVDEKERVFFGVRPCDMKAINLMEQFFSKEIEDPYYLSRHRRSTFLVMACKEPCIEESFCARMDAGPVADGAFDVQFLPQESGYLAWSGSEKGKKILAKYKKLFKKAMAKEAGEKNAIAKKFKSNRPSFDFKKLAKLIDENKVDTAIWEDIGQRCIKCSGCISLCPTCSCFSTVDRMCGDKGQRLRYWDGCPYSGFTRLAGGANPVPLYRDQIRRFFEHKLSVDFYNYKTPSCVGCGRCIKTCPGNINIRKFIEEVI